MKFNNKNNDKKEIGIRKEKKKIRGQSRGQD